MLIAVSHAEVEIEKIYLGLRSTEFRYEVVLSGEYESVSKQNKTTKQKREAGTRSSNDIHQSEKTEISIECENFLGGKIEVGAFRAWQARTVVVVGTSDSFGRENQRNVRVERDYGHNRELFQRK